MSNKTAGDIGLWIAVILVALVILGQVSGVAEPSPYNPNSTWDRLACWWKSPAVTIQVGDGLPQRVESQKDEWCR